MFKRKKPIEQKHAELTRALDCIARLNQCPLTGLQSECLSTILDSADVLGDYTKQSPLVCGRVSVWFDNGVKINVIRG